MENCYHETNTTAPYPDCCPSLVCKDDPHFNPSKIELVQIDSFLKNTSKLHECVLTQVST